MNDATYINGIDFTDIFTLTGGTVSYIKRRGNNSGVMMNGEYRDDVLGIKAVVTRICKPTNVEQLQQLLSIIAGTYVTLRYYDPRRGDYRTITAMPSEPTQKYRGECLNAVEYWTGTVITFTEK